MLDDDRYDDPERTLRNLQLAEADTELFERALAIFRDRSLALAWLVWGDIPNFDRPPIELAAEPENRAAMLAGPIAVTRGHLPATGLGGIPLKELALRLDKKSNEPTKH